MMKTNIPYSEKLTEANLLKVIDVSERLKIQPQWLMGVMNFETGGTLSPSKTNPIGSVGLIQFTRDKAGVQYKTIAGKQYQLQTIKAMSFLEQMELVYLYLLPYKGKMNSFIDTYFAVFFPNAIGKSDDFILETKGLSSSLIAKQNPVFDTNKDGKIKKHEVVDFFKKYTGKMFPLINANQSKSTYTLVEWIVLPLVLFFFSFLCLTF